MKESCNFYCFWLQSNIYYRTNQNDIPKWSRIREFIDCTVT